MSSSAGSHSLAFRVMRLCRPSFHMETPLRLDPLDLIAGEDLFDDPHALLSSHDFISKSKISKEQGEEGPTDLSYRNRFELQNPYDAMGLSGLLVLPQAFGLVSFSIHLHIDRSRIMTLYLLACLIDIAGLSILGRLSAATSASTTALILKPGTSPSR